MGMGPRAGLGELACPSAARLLDHAGKVNPVIAETLTLVVRG